MTTKPVVVLFDVDETLVHTGGAGARSWNAAFESVYGLPADIGQHTSAGETDPQVAARRSGVCSVASRSATSSIRCTPGTSCT